jgi:hypothetical protein
MERSPHHLIVLKKNETAITAGNKTLGRNRLNYYNISTFDYGNE